MNFPQFKFCPNCKEKDLVKDKNSITCKNCNFKYYPPTSQAGAILIRKDNKVLLAKRKIEPLMGYWTMPAGFASYGENPIDTALRELKEETGLSADFKSVLGIYVVKDDPRGDTVLTVVEVKNIKGNIKPSDDVSELEYFTKDNLPKIAFKVHKEVILKYL